MVPTEFAKAGQAAAGVSAEAHFRRWAIRADALLGIIAVVLLTIAGVMAWPALVAQGANLPGLVPGAIAGWVALVVACTGAVIKVTSARQNLVTLFGSEIRAIQFGLFQMDMFAFWERAFSDPAKGAEGFANAPRAEDYFAIFHSASGTIVNLHPHVVESVVRFYTYLKMSRDAAAALAGWEVQKPSVDRRKADVSYVVRLLSLAMLWGYVARYAMGHAADEADVEQLRELVRIGDAVLGHDTFAKLFRQFPREKQLRAFFGVAP